MYMYDIVVGGVTLPPAHNAVYYFLAGALRIKVIVLYLRGDGDEHAPERGH